MSFPTLDIRPLLNALQPFLRPLDFPIYPYYSHYISEAWRQFFAFYICIVRSDKCPMRKGKLLTSRQKKV